MNDDEPTKFQVPIAPTEDLRHKIYQLLPTAFSEDGKIIPEKLAALFGANGIDADSQRYGMTWPGKSEQLNKINQPSVQALVPNKQASKHWDDTNNLFIEGDNLEVLKLMQKAYHNKIKLIYIDPPYNTGKDFVYNDNFRITKIEHEAAEGWRDEAGNKRRDGLMLNNRERGHYHTNWLNMMYPRLFLARSLLKDDGVIFVSIDDNEVDNLKKLMNEIFGEDNFISQLVWNSATGGGIRARFVNQSHQYVLCYAKSADLLPTFWAPLSEEAISQYKLRDDKGLYREKDFAWRNSSYGTNQRYLITCPDGTRVKPKDGYLYRFVESRFKEELANNTVVFKKTSSGPLVTEDGQQAGWNIYIKKYLGEAKGAPVSVMPKSLVGMNDFGTKETNALFGRPVFENPKSTKMLKYIFSFVDTKDDLILDFFSGSGTTAHAVMALNAQDGGNRRWICVQLPEETDAASEAYKAGYTNIADIAKERIRRAGEKVTEDFSKELASRETPLDTGFKTLQLQRSNFKVFDPAQNENLLTLLEKSIDNIHDSATADSLVYELLLSAGYELTTAVMLYESLPDCYAIGAGDLLICLKKQVSEEDILRLAASKASEVLVRDSAFAGDSQLKVNAVQIFKQKQIGFRTV